MMESADPNMKKLRNQFVSALAVANGALLSMPQAASAMVGGKLSYSRFIEAVNANEIARVVIAPDGQSAKMITVDGNPAEVALLSDPNLFKLLEAHGVDLSIDVVN